MAHTPYPGAQAVQLILGTVMQVFQDFTYHRQLASADGLSVVLEFSANVNGKELKGIDLIQFDDDGKIVDFEVMVRPMSGLQAWATRWPNAGSLPGGHERWPGLMDTILLIAYYDPFTLGKSKKGLKS
jgi:hypothetical protein